MHGVGRHVASLDHRSSHDDEAPQQHDESWDPECSYVAPEPVRMQRAYQEERRRAPWYREEPHAETAEHLLVCPALRASRELFGIDKLRRKELVRNDKLARWLSHVFHLQSPVLLANPPD